MTSDDATVPRDPLDLLVERFLERRRSEPQLSVAEFAREHPSHETVLLDLLPTIVALEQHKRDRASSGSSGRRATVPQLERLGDFRIVREIGRGGMGVVFEAVQEALGRKVALKVLPQSGLLTGNQLERFRREAQIAAQLHHSNIVPVFGSGESDGYHWYAMQFIDGQGLDGWRRTQAEQPPKGPGAWRTRARFVARLGVQAASALHHAHSLGTLHRDVKPGNLLLQGVDHLWVTDFGLAKALEAESLTHSGDLLGTLQYMAPEQFAGQYDVCSEVYALGVTLYEMVTLQPAFVGISRSELMERIRQHRLDPVRRVCPDLPIDLAVIIGKACARDPRDRYADCAALARDLQAFLDDRPVEARPLSNVAQVWRWCRRNRLTAAMAASTLLALVVAGVIGWIGYVGTQQALARAAQESERAERNLELTLAAFGRVFDGLVGLDPTLSLHEDEETGEATVLVRSVDPRDVALLQEMLAFYDRFAAQNEGNVALRFETARACWRVAAIHARLGSADNLEAAARSYDLALAHLAAIGNRDVRRERATVMVESAQLARRRGESGAARRTLGEALQLVEGYAADGGRAARLELATVHYLLATDLPGNRRPPFGPGGRGAEFDRDRERERLPAIREHLAKATGLVDGVLAEDPQSADAQSLRARVLLSTSRFARRSEPGRGDGDRDKAQMAAIEALRAVVANHPERDDDRFALCRVLLEPSRRDEGPRGGRDAREAATPDAGLLREAVGHARSLAARQPSFREYQRVLAQSCSALGRALAGRGETGEGDAARKARLMEAESVLLEALRAEEKLGPDAAPVDRALLVQNLQTRRALVAVYEAQGRRDDVRAQVTAMLGRLEALVGERANLPRIGELLQARPGAPDGGGLREQLRGVIERAGDPALAERLRALIARLPARDDGPPPDGRRGR
jgi:hypothetical protein